MMKTYDPRRLGLLAVTAMMLAGCAAGPSQSVPVNAAKTDCCAGMKDGEGCGCCKDTGMCAMSGNGSNMTPVTGGGNDAAKSGCCAGMTAGDGCGCCKGMGDAAVTSPTK